MNTYKILLEQTGDKDGLIEVTFDAWDFAQAQRIAEINMAVNWGQGKWKTIKMEIVDNTPKEDPSK